MEEGAAALPGTPRGGSTALYLYVSSGFSPSIDEELEGVWKNFRDEKMVLVVKYAVEEAWG